MVSLPRKAQAKSSLMIWHRGKGMASYAQAKVSTRPETAKEFKAACGRAGISMASEISRFMGAYPSATIRPMSTKVGTRPERRQAVQALTAALRAIHAAEERYRDNIPENLQAGQACEKADSALERLEEAF